MHYRIPEYGAGFVFETKAGDVTVGEDGVTELTDAQADELSADGIMLIPHVRRPRFGRPQGEAPPGVDGLATAVEMAVLEGMERAIAAAEAVEQYASLPTKADAFRDMTREWR